jgi:hypothetical protein
VTGTDGRPRDPAAGSGRRNCVSGSFGGHLKARKESRPWLIKKERVSPHVKQKDRKRVSSIGRAATAPRVRPAAGHSYAEAHHAADSVHHTCPPVAARGLVPKHVLCQYSVSRSHVPSYYHMLPSYDFAIVYVYCSFSIECDTLRVTLNSYARPLHVYGGMSITCKLSKLNYGAFTSRSWKRLMI